METVDFEVFVKFSPIFFGISQNYSDFDRSDAKIATFQSNVKELRPRPLQLKKIRSFLAFGFLFIFGLC